MRLFITALMVIVLAMVTALGCGGGEIKEGVPFSIQVSPKNIDGHALGEFKFSVTVSSDEARKAVIISAAIAGASLEVSPEAIKPGEVAEIIVVPFSGSTGQLLTLNVEGERDGLIETDTATLFVGTES